MESGLWPRNLTNSHVRLQTRAQYVQLREADLEKKKQYCKSNARFIRQLELTRTYPDQQVMQAFQSAMQLLSQS